MDEYCSAHGGDEKCIQIFVQKIWRGEITWKILEK